MKKLFFFVLLLFLLLAVVFNLWLLSYFRATDTWSMYPSIPPRARMIVLRNKWLSFSPRRGDVVVFHRSDPSVTYTKRVIGLPGDTVTLAEDSVFVNDMERAYTRIGDATYRDADGTVRKLNLYRENAPRKDGNGHAEYTTAYIRDSDFINPYYCRLCDSTITLDSDELFVMGDNRDVSEDSRSFGPVPQENVLGVLLFVLPEQ